MSLRRRQLAAEQTAHPMSGPRRRPHALPGSFVTHGDFSQMTHTNCSPIFPARFTNGIPESRQIHNLLAYFRVLREWHAEVSREPEPSPEIDYSEFGQHARAERIEEFIGRLL